MNSSKHIFSDYIMTLGVNFLEKQINIQGNEIQLMIWDLGGQKGFFSKLHNFFSTVDAYLFCRIYEYD